MFEQKTALQSLERALNDKEHEGPAAELEHQRSISEIDAELAGRRHSEAQLSEPASVMLSAPIEGELAYLDMKVGDAVSSGASLALIKPDNRESAAVFKLSSNLVNRFSLPVSSEVAVTFSSAYGREKIVGKVASLSPTPFGATGTDYKLIVALESEDGLAMTEGMDVTLNLDRPVGGGLRHIFGIN